MLAAGALGSCTNCLPTTATHHRQQSGIPLATLGRGLILLGTNVAEMYMYCTESHNFAAVVPQQHPCPENVDPHHYPCLENADPSLPRKGLPTTPIQPPTVWSGLVLVHRYLALLASFLLNYSSNTAQIHPWPVPILAGFSAPLTHYHSDPLSARLTSLPINSFRLREFSTLFSKYQFADPLCNCAARLSGTSKPLISAAITGIQPISVSLEQLSKLAFVISSI